VSDSGPFFVGPTPDAHPRADASIDVIFVHGLGGDPFTTWQAEPGARFWPRWLAEEFPNINFYTVGYDSQLLAGVFVGSGASIIDRATILLDLLMSRPIKARAVVFIVHSLGGLIVKQMLRRCHDAANPSYKAFLGSVKAVSFLGTPHQGAQLANSVCAAVGLFLSKNVKELSFGHEPLNNLNEWFRNWAGGSSISVRSYYEVHKTKGVTIVDKVTANPYVLGCDPVALEFDHIGMCKPPSREAHIYRSTAAMLRELLPESEPDKPVLSAIQMHDGNGQADIEQFIFGERVAGLEPETLADYENFTTRAPDDRKTLAEKLTAAGRSYLVREGERKKERFSMTLQRHIAQPSALTHYTRMMASIEARFNRHALREIASGSSIEQVDQVVQRDVIDPVLEAHGASGTDISAATVDGALYYLTGNCHLRWDDNGED
jgi:hypothetical protein